MSEAVGLHWFAFTTAAQQERRAMDMLGQHAVETRLPVGVRDVKRPNGGVRKRAWPLLVGYAFAGFARQDDVRAVLAAIESARLADIRMPVRRVVATASGKPMALRYSEGRAWYETMDYSTVELPGGAPRPLGWGEGDTVRMTEGPFAGWTGPVARLSGERAKALLQMFGRLVEVDISVRQAVLVSKAPTGVLAKSSGSVPLDGARRRTAEANRSSI